VTPPEISIDPDVDSASSPAIATTGVPVDPPVAGALDPDWILARLSEAVRLLPRPVGRVTVRIVSDRTMAALHQRHCGDPSTTDVLTFPADDSGEGERGGGDRDSDSIFVDIAICADEARRSARRIGHEPRRELLLYALHGLLHCCGYDDHDDASFAAMHAEEDRILLAIGVGATFRSGPEADASPTGGPVEGSAGPSTERDSGGAT